MNGDISRLSGQGHPGQVELLDTECGDVGPVRPRDDAQFAVFGTCACHRDARDQPAAGAGMPSHCTVLVPAHVGDALNDAHPLAQAFGRVAGEWISLLKFVVGERPDAAEPVRSRAVRKAQRIDG